MATDSDACAVWAFIVGAALGVGATLFFVSQRKRVEAAFAGTGSAGEESGDGPCSVPEGADICFPEQ